MAKPKTKRPSFGLHHTCRLYPTGEYVDNQVLEADLVEHIAYNATMRPGAALFLDGTCVGKGIGVSDELIKIMEKKLKKRPVRLIRCTAPYR